jgi:hypothetical protein
MSSQVWLDANLVHLQTVSSVLTARSSATARTAFAGCGGRPAPSQLGTAETIEPELSFSVANSTHVIDDMRVCSAAARS